MNRFETKQRMGKRTVKTATWLLCAAAGSLVGCQAGVSEPSGVGSASDPSASTESVATSAAALTYNQDFFDDFNGTSLDGNTWQTQDSTWVNNELQCYDSTYNESGQHKTLEVSNGSLKLRVINGGSSVNCNNYDKNGAKHPNTQYHAARIASKNRKEYAGGKWTARISFYSWTYGNSYGQPSGLSGMFPAWWLLGGRNNEAPVQDSDETVCWPLIGSSEIDILEHFGSNGQQNQFAARGIKATGGCNNDDWSTYQVNLSADMSQFHEYQVENVGNNLIYRIDNNQVGANYGIGHNYPDPFFAILNYALNANMDGNSKEYAMTVDWVKHESANCAAGQTVALYANANGLYASARTDVSGNPVRAQATTVQGWELYDIVDAGNGQVGLKSHNNGLYVSANQNDSKKTLQATASTIQGWEKFQFVPAANGFYGLKSIQNGLYVSADLNTSATLEASWATTIGSWESFQCVVQ